MIRGRILFLLMALLLTSGMARAQVQINGNVYGGCNQGKVDGNTDVTINDGTIGKKIPLRDRRISAEGQIQTRIKYGNVYGGGNGDARTNPTSDKIPTYNATAGQVTGNTTVTIGGSSVVRHAVYGGGNVGSVGTCTFSQETGLPVISPETGLPTTYAANTGLATVTIGGNALIGPTKEDLINPTEKEVKAFFGESATLAEYTDDYADTAFKYLGCNEGWVFGSSRGYSGGALRNLSFVDKTQVTIQDNAQVMDVFGGGENGHVYTETNVVVKDNAVVGGIPVHPASFDLNNLSSTNKYYNSTSYPVNTTETELFEDIYGVGHRIFRGNVFGGGKGNDFIEWFLADGQQKYCYTAGRVYGNTNVTIQDDAKVFCKVYGGGTIASVGTFTYEGNSKTITGIVERDGKSTGHAYVNILGGFIGSEGTYGRNNGDVYGGGLGLPGRPQRAGETLQPLHQLVDEAYVGHTHVRVCGGTVLNSVYGGGASGHVQGNSHVLIKDSVGGTHHTVIGVPDMGGWHCNVYGGGGGTAQYTDTKIVDGTPTPFTHHSITAGRVFGDTYVDIEGGLIYHSVYGGGSLASVGTYAPEDPVKPYLSGGNAYVTITGGTIGTDGNENGMVYGSGRGEIAAPRDFMDSVTYVAYSHVNIGKVNENQNENEPPTYTGNAEIKGSVYGSGENGHVYLQSQVNIYSGTIGCTAQEFKDSSETYGTAVRKAYWLAKRFPYRGNIYGSGCGTDKYVVRVNAPGDTTWAYNPKAGIVQGNAEINIHGGYISHNVYGGGAMASVGSTIGNAVIHEPESTKYSWPYKLVYTPIPDGNGNLYPAADKPTGKVTVNIFGGHIGTKDAPADESGNVFGSSRGDVGPLYTLDTLAMARTTEVNINFTTPASSTITDDMANVIVGNVFGSGENGCVYEDTKVTLTSGIVGRTLYGGGSGTSTYGVTPTYSVTAGKVYGNTEVDMQGGWVLHSLYGGGNLASVGKGGLQEEGDNCGLCKVSITGGTVGIATMALMPPPDPDDDDYGYVFAGCRGLDSGDPIAEKLALCDNTNITVGGTGNGAALVTASVYGGCENGMVLKDTYVHITGDCQIGVGYNKDGSTDGLGSTSDYKFLKYTADQWRLADTAIVKGTFGTNSYTNPFYECSSWEYEAPYAAYDPYAEWIKDGNNYVKYDDDGAPTVTPATQFYYKTGNDTYVSSEGGRPVGSDGHTFYGSVFGGGSGYYAYEPGQWRRSAGAVLGNTRIDIDGGHILTNVYGGNEQTDVGTYDNTGLTLTDPTTGICTINMSGGTIGVPRSIDAIIAHPVTCYLFGGGKGDQRVLFNTWTNVGSVEVNVSGGHIFGSVFGGGEDGHVIGNVEVDIENTLADADYHAAHNDVAVDDVIASPYIGTQGLSYVDGNVFGGGRGFSGDALTAGAVCGNVEVNISGGIMLGSIYGGGRLASVGTYLASVKIPDPDHEGQEIDNPNYGKMQDGNDHGFIEVNISGGTIGNTRPYIYVRAEVNPDDITEPNFATLLNKTTGDLRMMTYDTVRVKADKQTHTTLPNILSHTISGNVYGGCMGRITKLDGTVSPIWPDLARCKKTRVTVSGDAVIRSSVYGGGELGTVLDSTTVNILGGTIGTEIVPTTDALKTKLKKYSNPNNFRYFYSLKDNTFKKKMDASGNLILDENDKPIWEFPEDSVRAILSLDTFFYEKVPSSYKDEADPHYHFGSVYGGGYGSRDRKAETDLTPDYSLELTNAPQRLAPVDIAGRVYGNTYVNVRGGQILENVYGGGDMASVGTNVYNASHAITGTAEKKGICTVRIQNDTTENDVITKPEIGPLDFTGLNGNVYAAGKGIGIDPDREHQAELAEVDRHDEYYKKYCNVDSTNLIVSGGHIWGSAFGGGADCHVLGNTVTEIREGALIGDLGITEFDGYVFGGGRNYQNLNKTAGRVQGNAYVNVKGGRIMCSIIGGGALSRVGVDVDGKIYGGISGQTTFTDSADHGNTVVSVSGNTATLTNAGTSTAPKLSSADSLLYKNYIGTTTYDAVNNKIILYKTAIGTGFGPYLLDCDYSIGDIFGGGKGDTRDTLDVTAGRVLNTYIKITDSPRIMADIYAGGEMGCIGWYDTSGLNANKYYDHTGYTHLDVSGTPLLGTHYEFSIINFRAGVTWSIIDTSTGASERLLHTCSGNIYGGGQGFVCDGYSNWVSMGRVRQTHVTINGVNMMGHVFGGGSRGVVTEDTWVKVKGGIIGTVIQDEHSGVLEGHNLPEYYYGSVFGGGYGNPHHDVFETVPDSAVGGDPCVAVGYAGRVYGNTNVEITGGQIMECVFGGGDLASVGYVKSDGSLSNSVCNVTISGNAIIGPLDMTGENAYVYGGGRGRASDPTEYYRKYCNVNNTNVFVNGGKIWGSTFGGASDAHVLGDVRTTVETGADIGTRGVTSYDGNIFGGGRNYLNSNHTNGRVGGNIYVTMGGGSIKGSIFGGGRLAMSGVDVNGHYAYTTDADVEKHGNVFITVRGNAFIGTNQSDSLLFADESVGDIFGSGKGDTKNYEDIFAGRVANATIIIEDDTTFNYTYDENDVKIDSTVNSIISPTIYGSVFGGGEMASLGYWDDKYAIKSFQTVNSVPTLVSNEAENTGRGSNYGHIYSNTGSATITITGSATIGTEDELKRYTMPPDDNSTAAERLTNVREHSSTVNPGDWTMYNDDGTVLHTCTGNVFGGSQGDIDRDFPHWVSMGRSRTATVTIGTKNAATGPAIMGCVFGGAEQGIVTEDTRVDIYSGTIGKNVNNTNSGKQFVYGDVYGAGYGCDDEKEWGVDCSILGCEPENDSTAGSIRLGIGWNPGLLGGRTFGDSRVSILGGEIRGSVYGGGSFASLGDDKSMGANATTSQYPVHGNSWVYIGWPSGSFDPMSDSPVVETYNTTGAIGSATIGGEVFGANNNAGTIYGNTNVHIYKTAHTPGNKLTVGGVDVVDGNYYPSGLKAMESPTDQLTVEDISSSKLDGYRGSLSDASRFALTSVYGGGNKAPHTPIADNGTTLVYVHYCNENTICNVYGGGNAADTKNNSIVIEGGRFGSVYGGGNGAGAGNPGANVSGTASTEIRGGIYDYVFGGSNQLGDIGHIVLDINNESGCEELIANGFGAGNESHGGGGTITIGCGTKFQKFFAGAQNADINSDIDVTINGGEFDEFFGGNNAGGTIYGNVTVTYHAGKINRLFGGSYLNGDITGKITVNVYSIDDLCPTNNLNYVFGGGKMAEYNPGLVNGKKINSPEVNIYKGTINNEVYGGGMGDGTANTAKVTSNPVVNIGPAYINPTSGVEYNQVVIGSPHSEVVADPVTHIKDVSNIGNVFGGGNAATTDGNTTVRVLNNSLVHGGVYGGGNAAVVTGNTDVQIGD